MVASGAPVRAPCNLPVNEGAVTFPTKEAVPENFLELLNYL